TRADGAVLRDAFCLAHPAEDVRWNDLDQFNGKPFLQEIWVGDQKVAATYHGDPQTGWLFVAFETASGPPGDRNRVLPGRAYIDPRPTKLLTFKDGITLAETYQYDTSNMVADGGQSRTYGNVTRTEIHQGDGGPLLQAKTVSYYHTTHPDYLGRNLIRLPEQAQVLDPQNAGIGRADYRDDRTSLQPSGAPNLVDVGPLRGNVTTQVAYTDPASGGGAISVSTKYYDAGTVYQVTDGRGNTTTTTRDFG